MWEDVTSWETIGIGVILHCALFYCKMSAITQENFLSITFDHKLFKKRTNDLTEIAALQHKLFKK